MPDYRWGIFLAEPEPGPHDRLRRPPRAAGVAGGAGRVPRHAPPAHRHPGRHRARVGRAAAPPRPDLPVALRPAQPLPGQRGGGPAPLGDGLPAPRALRPRRPRGGRGAAPAPLGRPRQAAHPRRVQRADARLALVLHVHVLHRPRRQVPAREPRRERLRPALPHLPLHADRGSAPHVRRRDGRRARRPAHVRADAGAPRPTTSAGTAASTWRRSRGTSTSTTRSRSTCSAGRSRRTPPTSTPPGSRAGSRRRRRPTTTGSTRRRTPSRSSTAAAS